VSISKDYEPDRPLRPRLPEKSEKADNEAVTESIHCPPFWRRYATVYAAHRHLWLVPQQPPKEAFCGRGW